MRNNNTRKNRLLALLLSGMMASSLTVALAACNDNSSSSSSSSESSSEVQTQKDNGLVKNASFENFQTSNGLNVIGKTLTGWTRKTNSPTTGSALTSKADSGIVDTTNWKELTTSGVGNPDFSTWTEDQAKENWDKMTVKDKLAYYDAWKNKNEDDEKSVSDLEFYEAFNIDLVDLPDCENPLTHDFVEGQEVTKDTNKNVLMLHNEYSNSTYTDLGTAQKFESSSTVTVKAGMFAEFSVWVKTSDLTSSSSTGESQAAVDKGAYISITNALGGNSLAALEVKNINTAGVETNNGWAQYKFYLQGSAYADVTFNIVLGLGQGGGTDRSEYVNGYAFFDDIECKLISEGDFVDATEYDKDNGTYGDDVFVAYFDTEKAEKAVNTQSVSYGAYVLDFASTVTDTHTVATSWEVAPTTEEGSNGTKYTAAAGVAGATTYQGLGLSTSDDTVGVFNQASLSAKLANDKYLDSAYKKLYPNVGENDARSSNILAEKNVLLLLSADGAAYTATSNDLTFTLAPNQFKAVSFLVKTSALNGFTGANAILKDGDTKISITSIDTTTVDPVDVGEDKDVLEGWVRCYFFVSNETEEDKDCTLSVGFGPTTVMDTAKSSYFTGWAAFCDFTEYTFADKDAFELAASGDYSKVVSLENKSDNDGAGDKGFDSPAYIPTDAIENGFANALNYTGVYHDSDFVQPNGPGTLVAVNQHPTAGLLNKEYADNYSVLAEMGGDWDSVIGNGVTQPLVIYNKDAQTKAYGFIGKEQTVSANSYAAVAVRVKASVGATASIYLVDTDDETNTSMLSWNGKRTYWYDDKGNVCVKDPSKKFNPTKDIAFKLQSNGLYKVNPNWAGASSVDANAYYANLSAYGKDADGNYVLGEDAVSYNYNNNVKHDGNDGIAFYHKDGKYYSTSAYTTEVNDLAKVSALPVRYDTTEASATMQQTLKGDGSWKTVIFYIHAGNQAKNYRLEVWSGTRDGNSESLNGANSYVMFDGYDVGTADSRFTSMVELRKETIENQKDGENFGKFFEGVYSFYDSDKFLRYDESIDENAVGNSYESYTASSYASGVEFLQYTDGENFETFVDYALSEQMPTADTEEDDHDHEEEDEHDHEFDSASAWLLAGSILIAATLLFAIIAVIIRKTLKKRAPRAKKVKKAKKDKKNSDK